MSKVMLVEDDNNLREIYEARLQAEGYQIVTAQDGEAALVIAKAEKPDLVISDVMMPKISGFEMLDILRNTEGLKDTKVIMLTALGQSDDQQRADRLGADRYLVKSQVTLEDIVKAAHELLGDEAPEAVQPMTAEPEPTPEPTPSVAPTPVTNPAPEPQPVIPVHEPAAIDPVAAEPADLVSNDSQAVAPQADDSSDPLSQFDVSDAEEVPVENIPVITPSETSQDVSPATEALVPEASEEAPVVSQSVEVSSEPTPSVAPTPVTNPAPEPQPAPVAENDDQPIDPNSISL